MGILEHKYRVPAFNHHSHEQGSGRRRCKLWDLVAVSLAVDQAMVAAGHVRCDGRDEQRQRGAHVTGHHAEHRGDVPPHERHKDEEEEGYENEGPQGLRNRPFRKLDLPRCTSLTRPLFTSRHTKYA